jgi:4-carboxymuconolactone decarboxylase
MRLPTLTYEQLDARQKETWNKHAERRDKPVGPYLTWLHSPDLMDKVSPLSNYFRFDCNLPVKIREFGLCVVSRFWDAQYSWSAHVDKAIAAGVPADVMKDIAAGRKPNFKADD